MAREGEAHEYVAGLHRSGHRCSGHTRSGRCAGRSARALRCVPLATGQVRRLGSRIQVRPWCTTIRDFRSRSWSRTSSANPLRAGELGRQIVSRAIATTGASIAGWLGVEAITDDEADRRLTDPPIPDLVGTPEAGEILGVSRQRVHQLRQREDFPPPVVELGAGPVWTQMSIEAFDESWTRKPGRPAAVAVETEPSR